MKRKFCWKIISLFLVIATLVTTLPFSVFAEEIKDESTSQAEIYIKDVKLVRAETKEEAYNKFAAAGYEFLEANLNEGTDGDGVWMGYTTTTDPSEAIYDMKLMNMKGGFTRTSMDEALASQKTAFAEMASDLDYLVKEFAVAYKDNRIPAKNAYTALNFFRVVENETEYAEENGLGYQLVHGGVTLATLTEILLFCDPAIVDSIIKILTMGIQIHTGNWLQALSNIGPYEEDTEYMEDEAELLRRAEQLLSVLPHDVRFGVAYPTL